MEIDLETAVGEIKQECEPVERRPFPFFFIVGAGISSPPLPLAPEIEQQCKAEAARHGRTEEPSGKLPIDTYSHWFGKAFPSRDLRRRYLESLMRGRPISRAALRFAHLLLDKKIASLVVTPNFDDFISRALTIFGQAYVICDHPDTAERIDPESPEIQIVHVHGTYWFYDCCNLRGEIERRSERRREAPVTMASLLYKILSRRSPLVVGYSGWEGDVIMTELQRRLTSALGSNLYWFCYRRSDADFLPAWLRDHSEVRLVLPPPATPAPGTPRPPSTDQKEPSPASLPAGPSRKQPPEVGVEEPRLFAHKVCDGLIRGFELGPPALTKDPLGFMADQLKASFFQEGKGETEEDPYLLRRVIAAIRTAKTVSAHAQSQLDQGLERVSNAQRRLAY